MKENVSNQENSPAERGGEDVPRNTKRSIDAERRRGGEERRKAVGTAERSKSKALDTLRENCGIIRKQASTDGGVLWKVMCVDVVQVRKFSKRHIPLPPLHGPGGMAYSDFEKAEVFKDTLEVTFQENEEPYCDDKIEEVEKSNIVGYKEFDIMTDNEKDSSGLSNSPHIGGHKFCFVNYSNNLFSTFSKNLTSFFGQYLNRNEEKIYHHRYAQGKR
ncbi:uncharacterized protein TNCV_2560581 [Trichonephila clavipes]|uniref:Uncharacterized protein n=1 Tax=Trichonephila clavipes TaxID=2585209 RepID=A0A8X6UNN0_TRICX|nr:uncharacterized protein TNCV_2560581 [Trichonephila clavipes]